MSSGYTLTRSELDQFEREGFIGPFEAFADPGILDRCKTRIETTIRDHVDHPLYGRFSVRDWHLLDDDLCAIFTHPAIVDRLRALAGENLILWRSKAFLKKKGDRELGWHQEWGYFDGEEIGNHIPSLMPANPDDEHWWNLSVWVAFDDITEDMGPVQFIRGSHHCRYPSKMVSLTESAFFHDPFLGVNNKEELIQLTNSSKLVLDINTVDLLDGIDPYALGFDELKDYLMKKLGELEAKLTLPFDIKEGELRTMPMCKGEFFIFTERCMHGSPPNHGNRDRLGVNCRVTTADTLVYPGRLHGNTIDGSNLDISRHHCILLSGKPLNPDNIYQPHPVPSS